MRVVRHFIKVAKWQFKRITCKHNVAGEASCPFTGLTYVTCNNCGKRIGAYRTNEQGN
jgi:hypothetical protein